MLLLEMIANEPVREKTNKGPTQTGLYSHRRWIQAGYFDFRK